MHLSDSELECYHLGMLIDDPILDVLEEHLLVCPECVDRAEEAADYVDLMRVAIIDCNYDLESR
jgi:hypothetical protein